MHAAVCAADAAAYAAHAADAKNIAPTIRDDGDAGEEAAHAEGRAAKKAVATGSDAEQERAWQRWRLVVYLLNLERLGEER